MNKKIVIMLFLFIMISLIIITILKMNVLNEIINKNANIMGTYAIITFENKKEVKKTIYVGDFVMEIDENNNIGKWINKEQSLKYELDIINKTKKLNDNINIEEEKLLKIKPNFFNAYSINTVDLDGDEYYYFKINDNIEKTICEYYIFKESLRIDKIILNYKEHNRGKDFYKEKMVKIIYGETNLEDVAINDYTLIE